MVFAERSTVFREALKKAKAIQEERLIRGALLGKYNCAMAIFCLKNSNKWGAGVEEGNWADREDLSGVVAGLTVNVVNYSTDSHKRGDKRSNGSRDLDKSAKGRRIVEALASNAST